MNPLTSPTGVGVFVRYFGVILTTAITTLGIMNWMDQEQVDSLLGMIPSFLEAITAIIMLVIPAYAIVTKSMSKRGMETAKETDAKVPADMPVIVKTPTGVADIKIPAQE